MSKHMSILQVRWLGSIDYASAWVLQRHLAQQRQESTIPDTLLLLEHHPPVITLGRASRVEHVLVTPEKLLHMGIQVVETDRGGDVAYHGPGQLVGYPIMDLREHGRDVHLYLRRVEEAIIVALSHFRIEAHRKPGLTGVWVGDDKIAAIGVKVSHWITMHGFALNVHPDLSHFRLIVPCGIHDKGVTSIRSLLEREVTLEEVMPPVIAAFAQVFNLRPVAIPSLVSPEPP
jgi:lipoyl(octanoyl) transferase